MSLVCRGQTFKENECAAGQQPAEQRPEPALPWECGSGALKTAVLSPVGAADRMARGAFPEPDAQTSLETSLHCGLQLPVTPGLGSLLDGGTWSSWGQVGRWGGRLTGSSQ